MLHDVNGGVSSSGDLGGRMILLVEHDAIPRTAMAQSLRTAGLKVLEAVSGKEALVLFDKNPVKVVIVNFALPDVDGLELMELMHERRPRLPTILISSYLSQRAGDVMLARSGRCSRFFAKPVIPSLLVEAVKELLI
jgi:DNA-binding NtrC family response regulator